MSDPSHLDPDIEAVAMEYGLKLMMPTSLLRLSEEAKDPLASGNAVSGRDDLRGKPLVTIDGEDARDFDDAVHCETDGKGRLVLTVAIADVSHFIAEGSPLDAEACSRGTSAYFPGMVLPMLPERYSEGLCSLRPDEDRLCLGFRAAVGPDGRAAGIRFFECVIRSRRRLTYTEAQDHLDGRGKLEDREAAASLESLSRLCDILESRRRDRGGLQLELSTTDPVIKGGKVTGFVTSGRLKAHRIIEECMLLANTCAAEYLLENRHPFLYRVHPPPPEERVSRLRDVLRCMGVKAGDLTTAEGLMAVASKFRNRSPLVVDVMTRNVLRTLESAVYTPDNIGHFGLGYDAYAHFTSPIRRYPDLTVHRAIKAVMRGERPPADLAERLRTLGAHCTEREQAADRASLNVISRKVGRTLLGRIGKKVKGVVSGMARSGMFVTMEGGVDGMVRFSGMDDYYEVNPSRVQAKGRRSGRSFNVGMEVTVRIEEVSKADGRCAVSLA